MDHLLTSTHTSHEESATTYRMSLLSSIAQDLTVRKTTGNVVQKDLANIVASVMKGKLPDDKVHTKLAKNPRLENIENRKTARVNPIIWNHISATALSTDVKYQKTQQSLIQSNCDKTLITALTDGVAMVTQCQHDLTTHAGWP